MPGTYPRSDNPYVRCLLRPSRRRYREAIASLHDLSKSMGWKLVVDTWANVAGDEAGWHASGSMEEQDHLTIKTEERVVNRGRESRKNVGHVGADGSIEDFGSPRPSLEWLTIDGRVPGMDAIRFLEGLKEKYPEEFKDGRRQLRDRLRQLRDRCSQNGVGQSE